MQSMKRKYNSNEPKTLTTMSSCTNVMCAKDELKSIQELKNKSWEEISNLLWNGLLSENDNVVVNNEFNSQATSCGSLGQQTAMKVVNEILFMLKGVPTRNEKVYKDLLAIENVVKYIYQWLRTHNWSNPLILNIDRIFGIILQFQGSNYNTVVINASAVAMTLLKQYTLDVQLPAEVGKLISKNIVALLQNLPCCRSVSEQLSILNVIFQVQDSKATAFSTQKWFGSLIPWIEAELANEFSSMNSNVFKLLNHINEQSNTICTFPITPSKLNTSIEAKQEAQWLFSVSNQGPYWFELHCTKNANRLPILVKGCDVHDWKKFGSELHFYMSSGMSGWSNMMPGSELIKHDKFCIALSAENMSIAYEQLRKTVGKPSSSKVPTFSANDKIVCNKQNKEFYSKKIRVTAASRQNSDQNNLNFNSDTLAYRTRNDNLQLSTIQTCQNNIQQSNTKFASDPIEASSDACTKQIKGKYKPLARVTSQKSKKIILQTADTKNPMCMSSQIPTTAMNASNQNIAKSHSSLLAYDHSILSDFAECKVLLRLLALQNKQAKQHQVTSSTSSRFVNQHFEILRNFINKNDALSVPVKIQTALCDLEELWLSQLTKKKSSLRQVSEKLGNLRELVQSIKQ